MIKRIYVYVSLCMRSHEGTCGGQKRALDPLKLWLWAAWRGCWGWNSSVVQEQQSLLQPRPLSSLSFEFLLVDLSTLMKLYYVSRLRLSSCTSVHMWMSVVTCVWPEVCGIFQSKSWHTVTMSTSSALYLRAVFLIWHWIKTWVFGNCYLTGIRHTFFHYLVFIALYLV